MTPDELRALADCLNDPNAMQRIARRKAADYLRACADAQPVAWRCEVRGDGTDPQLGAVDWRHYHTTTSEREAQAFVARCGDGIEGRAVPLYAHPAPAASQADIGRLRECAQRLVDGARWGLAGALSPSSKAREIPSSAWSDVKSRHLASLRDALAAPQAEPIADSDADYWLRNRQAILDAIERAGFVLMSNASGFWMHPRGATDAQAEPKREPLSDESPKVEWLSTDDAETQLALAIRDAVKVAPSADDKALLYALNRRGIWLAWIGGSDAE